MAEADALHYIRQVADALDEIHKKQLRHLDVKPSNIMLNQRGEAVLIDFGLVKVYDEEGNPLSTHSSTQNGYSSCFSPMEQVFSDKDTVFTPATDIYALGATLYNLVEGTVPPTIDKVAKMKGNLPFSETTSQPMRKAITEAMQLNAEDRPQTIAEFLKLLPQPQKVEKDPNAVYKKELAEGVALFQSGEYVKALSRFLMLFQTHPDHKPEIGEWMMKCTEKMNDSESGGGETLRRKEEKPVLETKLNGHEYVDLGLSVKWATCNVGASVPSDYGDYFAWGETKPKSEYTKMNSVTLGKRVGDIGGNPYYDAARANWGGSWRLPTKDELIELKEKCIWRWTTQGGHNGYKVTGPSGKSIFFPAAGWRNGPWLDNVGEYGDYWNSAPYERNAQCACYLNFGSSYYNVGWIYRDYGRSVRPVSD